MSESETPRDPQDPVEQPDTDAAEPDAPDVAPERDVAPEPASPSPPPPRDQSHQLPPPSPPAPPGPPPPGPNWGTHGGNQPPPPSQHRRLTRRSDDRVLAGVASGLGDYFNVDPAIFRLVFVILTFFGGSGLMLYVLGWLMLPERSSGSSVGEDLVRRAGGGRSVIVWVVVAIVAVVVIENTSFLDHGFLWAVLLIGAGVLFFRQDDTARAGAADHRTDGATLPPAPPPPVPPQPAARQETTRPESPLREPHIDPLLDNPMADPLIHDPTYDPANDPAYRPTYDDWRPTPVTAPPEPPPPPSVLGRITVAVVLILGGLLALLHNLTPLSVGVDQYAALGLAVVGAGLVVGARLGRSHGLIPLGIILAIVMTVASNLGDLSLPSQAGQERWTPTTDEELPDRGYQLDAGQLDIDLTQLELEPGQRVTVNGSVDLGQLYVDVPSDVTVDVNATSSLGEVEAFGRTVDGADATIDRLKRAPEGSPTIVLDLEVGLGRIEVSQESGAASPREAPEPPATREPRTQPQ